MVVWLNILHSKLNLKFIIEEDYEVRMRKAFQKISWDEVIEIEEDDNLSLIKMRNKQREPSQAFKNICIERKEPEIINIEILEDSDSSLQNYNSDKFNHYPTINKFHCSSEKGKWIIFKRI